MSHIAQSDRNVYADYAAFSPIDKDVLVAMLPYYESAYGNPSSLHLCGRRARKELELARTRIAVLLGVKNEEIVFTSGGTESNNLALLGVARANANKGKHIIISAIEHQSIVEAAHQLERDGWKVDTCPVLPDGVLDIEACMRLISEETVLISVMYVNNEIGTIQPIRELARRLQELPKSSRPLFHTDACQAGNVLSLSPTVLGVDLMTINSTKLSGPSGVGLLYRKSGILLEPIIAGGEQERGVRAGTESLPLVVGFSLALSKAQRKHEEEAVRLRGLRNYFINGLKNRIPSVHVHGNEETQSPSIVHVTIPRIEGEAILLLLDSYGIYASTGSACASLRITASHVLTAIGHDPESIHGSIRFSFGKETTKDDIDYILGHLPLVTERLCSMTAIKERKI